MDVERRNMGKRIGAHSGSLEINLLACVRPLLQVRFSMTLAAITFWSSRTQVALRQMPHCLMKMTRPSPSRLERRCYFRRLHLPPPGLGPRRALSMTQRGSLPQNFVQTRLAPRTPLLLLLVTDPGPRRSARAPPKRHRATVVSLVACTIVFRCSISLVTEVVQEVRVFVASCSR